jgi:hypothetical protein
MSAESSRGYAGSVLILGSPALPQKRNIWLIPHRQTPEAGPRLTRLAVRVTDRLKLPSAHHRATALGRNIEGRREEAR